jgi:hypothetical protein
MDEQPSAGASPEDQPRPKGDETPLTTESPASDAKPPQELHRSNEFWLAITGVSGTLLSAIVAGVFAFLTNSQQIAHQAANTQASFTQENKAALTAFTRAQRVQAYTTFQTAIIDYLNSWNAEVQKRTDGFFPGMWKPAPGTAKYDLPTSYANVNGAKSEVLFFSSDEVNNAVDKLIAKISVMHSYAENLPQPASSFDAANAIAAKSRDLKTGSDAFVCAARLDLDVPACGTGGPP